jgi:hypothetical protein
MARALFVAASLAASTAALACGVCVEDKVASTYDYALVTRAIGQGHHVAFFHLDGDAPKDEPTRKALLAAAESTAGVDKESARVSVDTMTMSFAFDPARVRLIDIQTRIDRKLAARKLTLFPMRVIERPAELKSITKR